MGTIWLFTIILLCQRKWSGSLLPFAISVFDYFLTFQKDYEFVQCLVANILIEMWNQNSNNYMHKSLGAHSTSEFFSLFIRRTRKSSTSSFHWTKQYSVKILKWSNNCFHCLVNADKLRLVVTWVFGSFTHKISIVLSGPTSWTGIFCWYHIECCSGGYITYCTRHICILCVLY